MASAFEIQHSTASTKAPDAHNELRFNSSRIDKARKLLMDLPPGTKILDVGCSDGSVLAPFSERLECYGIDAVGPLVAQARDRGIRAEVGDVEKLPYDAESFDAVFAGEVIEHTISPDSFLCGLNRVLRPGGVAILTLPNIRTPVGIAMMLLGRAPMYAARYRSAHFRDFTADLIRRALANNGFHIDRFTGSSFMIPPIGPRFPLLAEIFPSWADHFIVRAKKIRTVVYDPSVEYMAP